MSDFRTYAQRRLSPFLGTVQVIEVDDGRALSYDGRVWQIQLRAQIAVAAPVWGGIGNAQTSRPFFHYGIWSSDDELQRLPLNPALGNVAAYPALAELLSALRERPRLPFCLRDRYECWVLDNAGLPVLLFASACDDRSRSLPGQPRWQASHAQAEPFQSAALQAANTAADKPHAAWLSEQLVQRVGMPLSLQWILRDEQGDGVGMDGKHLRPEWLQRQLPASLFPSLLLSECWDDPLTTAVVQDYLAWQSPYLLMLPTLSEAQRRVLEIQACAWPQTLLQVRPLLPEVLDKTRIDVALVRARLEQS